MSDIYLKAAIEKNLRSQNFNLLSFRNLSPGQFLGTPTSTHISLNFKTFCWNLKNQRSGSKTVSGFSTVLILKAIMSKNPYVLLNKIIHFNKSKTELKAENPTHSFRETNLVLQLSIRITN